MSVMLRILLIVFSVITSIVVIHKIRKSKLRIDDAVFWFCFSLALIVMASLQACRTYRNTVPGKSLIPEYNIYTYSKDLPYEFAYFKYRRKACRFGL